MFQHSFSAAMQQTRQHCSDKAAQSSKSRHHHRKPSVPAAACSRTRQQRVTAAWNALLLLCAALFTPPMTAAAPSPTPSAAAAPAAAIPAQVPRLELAKWNQAYKMSIPLITAQQQEEYTIINMDTCAEEGYDMEASAAPLEGCYYKKYANGSYSYWRKKPGDWRVNGNCYCYALNVYKGGFCIPGNGTLGGPPGSPGTAPTCEVLKAAILQDGAVHISRQRALTTQPPTGHYIGLLARNTSCNPYHCWREDFHAIRKDTNGLWSWKEPGGPASDLDLFGNKISDPENSILPGNYEDWCGYYWVHPDTMIIGGNFREEYKLQSMADVYSRLLGVDVALTPTPYNQTVDGAFDSWSSEQIKQDVQWENQRGTLAWTNFYNTARSSDPTAISSAIQGSSTGRANLGRTNIGTTVGRTNLGSPDLGPTNIGSPAGSGNLGRTNLGRGDQGGTVPPTIPPGRPVTNLGTVIPTGRPVTNLGTGGTTTVLPGVAAPGSQVSGSPAVLPSGQPSSPGIRTVPARLSSISTQPTVPAGSRVAAAAAGAGSRPTVLPTAGGTADAAPLQFASVPSKPAAAVSEGAAAASRPGSANAAVNAPVNRPLSSSSSSSRSPMPRVYSTAATPGGSPNKSSSSSSSSRRTPGSSAAGPRRLLVQQQQ